MNAYRFGLSKKMVSSWSSQGEPIWVIGGTII